MKNLLLLFIALLGVIMVHAQAKRDSIAKAKPGAVQYGTASYYGGKFNGRKTSTGELFDEKKMTCAHNTLPLNTWVKVTNLRNNKSVVVRVNDRLHHKNKRLVDLSKAAATKLGYIGRGLTRVKVEVLGKKLPAS
ncbi:MAG: septal ring lytic transglycosylase RlpA family protein [Sphingobacteriales bacterium]|jgi:rare lipoprotein A|nr:MAG: septal ring lytic transglycosylase RlpA family protein [Sphingobacteriales bacterium]